MIFGLLFWFLSANQVCRDKISKQIPECNYRIQMCSGLDSNESIIKYKCEFCNVNDKIYNSTEDYTIHVPIHVPIHVLIDYYKIQVRLLQYKLTLFHRDNNYQIQM